jgi:hypothetical protein
MIDLYKIEEVNDNRFYQVPKELFQNPCYRFNLTTDAKLVYSILLDRMELSRKNNWVDSKGYIYLLYTKENLANVMGVSESSIYKAFRQLERLELIKQERQGLNKPNKIYIGKIKWGFVWICKFCRSRPVECKGQDLDILEMNETVYSDTYINETDRYITLPSDDECPFLNIYKDQFRRYMGKEHMRVTEDQLFTIEEALSKLVALDITEEEFEEAVTDHFKELPSTNNGNILAFLHTCMRRFEVDVVHY